MKLRRAGWELELYNQRISNANRGDTSNAQLMKPNPIFNDNSGPASKMDIKVQGEGEAK